ncbi:MAG: hypothetical protein ACLRZ7_08725 [Lachnospiraceae bacterium]
MGRIVVGLLFLLFQFDLDRNGVKIGLIPDFVGFFLIGSGLLRIRRDSAQCEAAIPWAMGLGMFSFIVYMANLFGINAIPYIEVLLDHVIPIVTLYLYYLIADGILQIEKKNRRDLNGDYLKRAWFYLVFITIISFFGFVNSIFKLLITAAVFVCHLYYIFCMNDVRKRYSED